MMRASAALGLAALLCGCATAPRLPPAGPEYDGTYVGHTVLLRGGGFPCGIADLPQRIVVTNGRFQYPFQVDPPTVAPLQVQVRANGIIDHQEQYFALEPLGRGYLEPWVTLRGQIQDGRLVATEDDWRCTRRTVLARVGPP